MPSCSKTSLRLCCFLALFAVLPASPAHALQAHGYMGLYVHQGAHLFFLLSMVIFSVRVRRSPLIEKKAWQLMVWGARFLALWSLWAFSGHFLELFIPDESIITVPGQKAPFIRLQSWKEVVYYLLKMDHLLSIPAIVCFYLGLKATLAEPSPNKQEASGAA
jgi:hypothetical protein